MSQVYNWIRVYLFIYSAFNRYWSHEAWNYYFLYYFLFGIKIFWEAASFTSEILKKKKKTRFSVWLVLPFSSSGSVPVWALLVFLWRICRVCVNPSLAKVGIAPRLRSGFSVQGAPMLPWHLALDFGSLCPFLPLARMRSQPVACHLEEPPMAYNWWLLIKSSHTHAHTQEAQSWIIFMPSCYGMCKIAASVKALFSYRGF